MKVKIEVYLEVDAKEWAVEYGCEPSEVRADVKRWAENRLHDYEIVRAVTVR